MKEVQTDNPKKKRELSKRFIAEVALPFVGWLAGKTVEWGAKKFKIHQFKKMPEELNKLSLSAFLKVDKNNPKKSKIFIPSVAKKVIDEILKKLKNRPVSDLELFSNIHFGRPLKTLKGIKQALERNLLAIVKEAKDEGVNFLGEIGGFLGGRKGDTMEELNYRKLANLIFREHFPRRISFRSKLKIGKIKRFLASLSDEDLRDIAASSQKISNPGRLSRDILELEVLSWFAKLGPDKQENVVNEYSDEALELMKNDAVVAKIVSLAKDAEKAMSVAPSKIFIARFRAGLKRFRIADLYGAIKKIFPNYPITQNRRKSYYIDILTEGFEQNFPEVR